MKKLCTILTALALFVLCLVLLPTEVQAAEVIAGGKCGSNVEWELDSAGVLTIFGSGDMADLGIYEFSSSSTYFVAGTKAPWISYSDTIKKVVIDDGVRSIGDGAFWGCNKLTSVSIPSSISSIGDAAFENCTSLKSVYITDVAAWCDIFFYDFDSSPLRYAATLYLNDEPITDLIIPNSVSEISAFAFYSCWSLTNVTIPDSVTTIGQRAFAACSNLTNIQVAEDNAAYRSDRQGILYNKDQTTLLQAPGAITSCVIPEGVTTINSYAFRSCANLRTVTIPASVVSIGGFAFNYCHSLRGVYISDLSAWCKIDFGSFSANPLNYANILYLNNRAVTELVIPEDITEIKNFAFFNCQSIAKVVLSEGVTTIGIKAFYNCLNMEIIAIPQSMQEIKLDAFFNCAALREVDYHYGDADWGKIKIDSSNIYLLNAVRSHDWDGYACKICGYERIDETLVYYSAPSLSFQDYIGIQILIRNIDVAYYDSVFVIAEQEGPDGVVQIRLEGIPFYGVYQLFDQQILSWSMSENVTMTLCGEKDGAIYKGATISGSVKSMATQAILMYAASNPKVCRVLVDMLNYGTAVQIAFERNLDNLPNADLGVLAAFGTTTVPAFAATNSITGEAKVPVWVNNISLQSKVEIQMLFDVDVSSYTAKAVVNGEEVPVWMDMETYGEYGWALLRVAVKAAQMRETFTIALYDADGNPVTQVYAVSVEGYAASRQGGFYNDLDIAMIRYGDSVSQL